MFLFPQCTFLNMPIEDRPDDEIVWAILAIIAERRPLVWEDGVTIRRELSMWRSLCGEAAHA